MSRKELKKLPSNHVPRFTTIQGDSYMKVAVEIANASNLESFDANGFSDPFVVLFIDGSEVLRTETQLKTLNPAWNLKFDLFFDHPGYPLTFELWDWDKITADDFMGQVQLPFAEYIGAENTNYRTDREFPILDPDNRTGKGSELGSLRLTFAPERLRNVVFNPSLAACPLEPGHSVPRCVFSLVEGLRPWLEEEGIMRLAGSKADIEQLRYEFETQPTVNLKRDPNTLASLLKQFFRELAEPLIPQAQNDAISAIFKEFELTDFPASSAQRVTAILQTLPPVAFATVALFFNLLRAINNLEKKNKMTINNLCVCVVPSLRCSSILVGRFISEYPLFFT